MTRKVAQRNPEENTSAKQNQPATTTEAPPAAVVPLPSKPRPLAVARLEDGRELRLAWHPGRGLGLSVWTESGAGKWTEASALELAAANLPALSEGVGRAACEANWELARRRGAPVPDAPEYETIESLRRELDAMRSQRDHWRRTAADLGDEIGDARARLGGSAEEQIDGPRGLAARVKAKADLAGGAPLAAGEGSPGPTHGDGGACTGGGQLRILRLERALAYAKTDGAYLATYLQEEALGLLGELVGRIRALADAFEGAAASAEESGLSFRHDVRERLERLAHFNAEIAKLAGPALADDELCEGADEEFQRHLAEETWPAEKCENRAHELLSRASVLAPAMRAHGLRA